MEGKNNLAQLFNSEIDLLEAYNQLKVFSKAQKKEERILLAGLIENRFFTKIKRDTPIQAGQEKYRKGFDDAVSSIVEWLKAKSEH